MTNIAKNFETDFSSMVVQVLKQNQVSTKEKLNELGCKLSRAPDQAGVGMR